MGHLRIGSRGVHKALISFIISLKRNYSKRLKWFKAGGFSLESARTFQNLLNHEAQATHWLHRFFFFRSSRNCSQQKGGHTTQEAWWRRSCVKDERFSRSLTNKYFRSPRSEKINKWNEIFLFSKITNLKLFSASLKCLICLRLLVRSLDKMWQKWNNLRWEDKQKRNIFLVYWFSQHHKRSNRIN